MLCLLCGAEGKPVPTELKHEAVTLQNKIALDEPEEGAGSAVTGKSLKTHIDDEYARAGMVDPKLLITTSRDPSSRLIQFVKEFRLCLPNSQRINRGNTQIKELMTAARAADCSDVVIVHEHRGMPDGMIVSHLPFGPTAYFGLSNVVLRHDITKAGDVDLKTVSRTAQHTAHTQQQRAEPDEPLVTLLV